MADSLLDDTGNQSNKDRDELFNKWKDKTKEEILAAKVEGDLYIKTQNARMDAVRDDYIKLREEATTKASLQELIDQHKKNLANTDTDLEHLKEPVNQPSLKAEDIETLLEKKLTERDRSTKQTENFNFVKAKLKELFGDNASANLKQRMDTLGLDQAFTDELAKNHPTVFLKTFGLDEPNRQTDSFAPPRSTVRPDRFAPVKPKRDYNYYQELLKKDPRGYLDPKLAIQMHNDALDLGEEFGLPKN